MDISTLVPAVMALLAPFVAKGAEEFARTAGKAAAEKAGALLRTLRERWSKDDEAKDALTKFEQKPERYRPVVEDILTEAVKADPAFAQALSQILGPVQQMASGKYQIQIAEGQGIVIGDDAKVEQYFGVEPRRKRS
ncbi:MAG TPA: hypothetical protein EYP49_08020 [Anaerolineae bacterium]|nr:hypothetical protein [Anaerolineae bacterium]